MKAILLNTKYTGVEKQLESLKHKVPSYLQKGIIDWEELLKGKGGL